MGGGRRSGPLTLELVSLQRLEAHLLGLDTGAKCRGPFFAAVQRRADLLKPRPQLRELILRNGDLDVEAPLPESPVALRLTLLAG